MGESSNAEALCEAKVTVDSICDGEEGGDIASCMMGAEVGKVIACMPHGAHRAVEIHAGAEATCSDSTADEGVSSVAACNRGFGAAVEAVLGAEWSGGVGAE